MLVDHAKLCENFLTCVLVAREPSWLNGRFWEKGFVTSLKSLHSWSEISKYVYHFVQDVNRNL